MNRSLKRISVLISLGTLLSKLGGMARQVVIASVFGINSFFFSFTQNRLSNTTKHFEALDALLTSTTTDQISTIAELKRNYLLCQSDFPKACENYFTALIQTRNRAKDYQITFAETLGLSEDNALFDIGTLKLVFVFFLFLSIQ